jgi:hypothetical protein
MEFGIIIIEGINTIKKNIIIIAPTIIASLIVLIATSILMGNDLASLDDSNPEKAIMALRPLMPRLFAISVFSYFLQAFTHCVTIAMAMDAVNSGTCNIFNGYMAALRRIGNIVPGAFLILIFLTIGLMLLILPALLVCFAFMLTFIIIMRDNVNPVMAMKKSFRTMKGNFSNSIVLFFFLAALGITVSLTNVLFTQLPQIGVAASLFSTGVFMSFTAITLLKFYQILHPLPPVEQQ